MIKSFKNLCITDKFAIIILQILFICAICRMPLQISLISDMFPNILYLFPYKLKALNSLWIIIINLIYLITWIKNKSFIFMESKFTPIAIHTSFALYLISEIFFIAEVLSDGDSLLMIYFTRAWWLNLFNILIILMVALYWASVLKKKSIIDELTIKRGSTGVSILLLILLVCNIAKANALPKCDSIFAEQQVKEIFEQNELGDSSLSKIEMDMMIPEKFDKDLNKYECSARLSVVTIHHIYDKNPHTAEYTANYTIYKERGKNKVVSSFRRRH